MTDPPIKKKIVTGFCNTGAHEGMVKYSPSGKVQKPCEFLDICGCECHTRLRQMRSIAGLPEPVREPPPTVADAAKLASYGIVSIIRDPDGGGTDKEMSVINGPVVFKPTKSGRRAKGQLEHEVYELCKQWVDDQSIAEFMTPAKCAELLDPDDTPSAGAVDQVFRTWSEIGFALIARKPTRFIGFMPDGVKLGLTQYKEVAKRRAKTGGGTARR